VVITNPTHYAVALSFDFDTMDAPRVLVKGRNLVAEQIKSEARWAGVPIVENPPLARSLYRTVEAGQAIPFELYAAVAGILAYLYRQQVEERIRRQQAAARAEVAETKLTKPPVSAQPTDAVGSSAAKTGLDSTPADAAQSDSAESRVSDSAAEANPRQERRRIPR
jgi:flagellar biosynthesis protein FlhB